MREVSDKHKELSERLHRQRLEVTGTLVASIAHDLRTPLTSIIFNATRLARALSEDDPTKSPLDEILAAADRLRTTVDGLLEFARVGPPVSTTVDLRELAERVSGFVRPVLRDGNHVLRCEITDDARYVSGNPLTIEQILVNLVVNAAQASPAPIEISVATFRRARLDEPRICVRVCDGGPGIPEELVHRIFEPFYTTKPRGTGLGLPMARGGRAQARRRPRARPRVTGRVLLGVPPVGAGTRRGGSVTSVIVVDDDDDVRSAVGRELEERGFDVRVASSVEGRSR
ncbi:MAG: ATP-binding protein [Sandaracinaceae bacterium]|nr:ATP-binding protein [Sandaracinaceae bacterium]